MPRWEASIYNFLLFFSFGVGSIQLYLFRNFMVDDAFITLRYVKNALEGHGVVYNVGERVEGFTSPLHVFLIYLMGLFEIDIVLASKILGVTAFWTILVALCFWGISQKDSKFLDLPSFVVTFSIVATSFSLTFFSMTGMETSIFSLLTVLVFMAASRLEIDYWLTLLILLAFLCRPEGITFLPWLLLAFYWIRKRDKNLSLDCVEYIPYLNRSEIVAVTFLVLCVIFFESMRWLYYGELFPNTFFAKAPWTMDSGNMHWSLKGLGSIIYVFSASGGILGILLFFTAIFRADRTFGILLLVSALTLAQLFFQKYAGSDWMIGSRYFITILPVWALGLGICVYRLNLLSGLKPLSRCLSVSVFAIIIALANFSETTSFIRNSKKYPNNVQTSVGLREIGTWIKENVPGNFRIRNWRIGAIGYYCDNPIVDTWGLVDKEIGRLRFRSSSEEEGNMFVRTHVEKIRPEVIITTLENRTEPYEKGYKLVHEGFNGSESLGVWVRDDLSSSIKKQSVE